MLVCFLCLENRIFFSQNASDDDNSQSSGLIYEAVKLLPQLKSVHIVPES